MPTHIELSRGYIATIDDEDMSKVSGYRWHATSRSDGKIYAAYRNARENVYILMHRLIVGAMPGQQVDHIDGDGSNNQKSNLRICNAAGNARNRKKTRGSSRFKGVRWDKACRKWRVEIIANRKSINGGLFTSEEDAARRYDELALLHFGNFARLNFGN